MAAAKIIRTFDNVLDKKRREIQTRVRREGVSLKFHRPAPARHDLSNILFSASLDQQIIQLTQMCFSSLYHRVFVCVRFREITDVSKTTKPTQPHVGSPVRRIHDTVHDWIYR